LTNLLQPGASEEGIWVGEGYIK